jgi:Spy/CpxP family protein refolding chaperone
MRNKFVVALGVLLLAPSLHAQETVQIQDGPPPGGKGRHVRIVTREMGKWWENQETVQKLGLNDTQVQQLNQVFYDHKLKFIDYGAAMAKEDFKLQNLLDADQPNESQVSTQVDQVLTARGKLEREYTMMNLDLRKVLSVEQWRQLKSIRGSTAMPGPVFYQKFHGEGGMGVMVEGGQLPDRPLPPPPPGGPID